MQTILVWGKHEWIQETILLLMYKIRPTDDPISTEYRLCEKIDKNAPEIRRGTLRKIFGVIFTIVYVVTTRQSTKKVKMTTSAIVEMNVKSDNNFDQTLTVVLTFIYSDFDYTKYVVTTLQSRRTSKSDYILIVVKVTIIMILLTTLNVVTFRYIQCSHFSLRTLNVVKITML